MNVRKRRNMKRIAKALGALFSPHFRRFLHATNPAVCTMPAGFVDSLARCGGLANVCESYCGSIGKSSVP